ncbi:MAG: hypothetical protein E7031_00885 [Akkermansiaceae bacterium]|nr:hypothetical protein [Akkermansiaceae bacterium]
MNGFRIAILTLMVFVVALLFYFVVEMLPNQQRAYEDYARTKAVQNLALSTTASPEESTQPTTPEELNKLRVEAQEAAERVQSNEEIRTLAQAEEQQRRAAEEEMAAQLAKESAEAAAIGMVTGVALEEGFLSFKPLGEQQISEGLIVALRRGDDDYIICEATVQRYHESGEWIADIRQDSFSSQQDGAVDRPKPAEGDLVIITPFETGDELRRESQDIPAATGE